MKKTLGILTFIIVIALIGIFTLNKGYESKTIIQSKENKNKNIIVLGSEPGSNNSSCYSC